jgi:hypothetical protein
MTAVGDKQILMTETLLLPDDEVGKFEVQLGETRLPVTIQFLSKQQPDPSADWQYTDGILNIRCAGWNSLAIPGSMAKPLRFGKYSGKSLGFNFVNNRVGEINLVTLQFYLGGEYE